LDLKRYGEKKVPFLIIILLFQPLNNTTQSPKHRSKCSKHQSKCPMHRSKCP